ncbi:MAG: DNA-3-methyladenine glycosylase [Clostridiales bacterium]|nr:DNA-3-methyladenine glycosylase [Candidatus Cacconaster stercorequi]
MAILCREFYIGDTVEISRNLLGKYLVRIIDGQPLVCRITETEAYVGSIDKACHAYGYHKTPRNAPLFGPPGYAYVYLIYGMHCCLNFVTNPEGEPEAVLLRGLEPVYGTQAIARARFGCSPDRMSAYQRKNFLNGPGKCCKGLSIDRSFNQIDLTVGNLFLCTSPVDVGLPEAEVPHYTVHTGKRIGIDYAEEAVDFPWRFWLEKG